MWKFFGRWSKRGLPQELTTRLRRRLRGHQGRDPEPTAVIVDSQIVKTAGTAGKGSRGFHGGKKINGRGRHVAADCEGWLLGIVVAAASVSDRAGAKLLVPRLLAAFTTLRLMWADSGLVGALEPGRTSWTLPLDAIRPGPADDATEVTAAQVREVADRLAEAGHWQDGDPAILAVFGSGYDLTRLAWLLADPPIEITGRLRSDRAMYFPAPPRPAGRDGLPWRIAGPD